MVLVSRASVRLTYQKEYMWPVRGQHEDILVRRPGSRDGAFPYCWPHCCLRTFGFYFYKQRICWAWASLVTHSSPSSLPPPPTGFIKNTPKPGPNVSLQQCARANGHFYTRFNLDNKAKPNKNWPQGCLPDIYTRILFYSYTLLWENIPVTVYFLFLWVITLTVTY